ncbi:MAG: hypothetical protein KAT16_04775 [Candidatus Heimdallarchaeota archaeon]|nr:hypothetical protein [Candidatus Heimdallarchaeota archaeon]
MASLIRPTQEQLKTTVSFLNYNGPIFSSVKSPTKDDDKSILKIISSSAY